MIEVDPAFQKSQARAKKRRAQRRLQRIAVFSGGGLVVALLALGVFWLFSGGDDDPVIAEGSAAEEGQFVQVETDEVAAPPVRASTPFVDIAGDPMILRFASGEAQNSLTLTGPMTLDARRVGNPRPDRLSLVREPLIVQERQLITALPSSREDFAFFQAQRSASLNAPALPVTEVATPEDELDVVVVAADSDDSWGTAVGADEATPASYVETRIENTTSVSFVKPEAQRRALYQDIVVRMVTARGIADVLATNGFDADAAKGWADQIASIIPEAAEMAPGSIVAIRAREELGALVPLQLSLYGPQGYINSTARRGALGFEPAADPWVDVDLYALSSPTASIAAPQQDYRLLDAVYSAVIRKGVPTTLVGEMIVMMSQAYDLDAFAAPGDEVTVLYAPAPGPAGSGPGQILFAGITGPSGEMPCYVSADDEGKFSCFSNSGRAGAAAQGGFTTPVQGTLTSKFGPRHHPILKTVRLHGGVDWAAPTGTPIVAALGGTLAVVGDGGGYGNVIYIDHPGGLQSRYAHMSRFGEGMRPGRQVRQGEVIGYVGTTGRSTGPHLHFEFRQNGTPVDPFTVNPQGGTVVASGGGAASGAVEALVNQIIKVESAGNANAKNPLSTATGLGQFIESTWLRMMRDYRPDLAGTMSRSDLLALRTDPTLSREMVTNLARENERFLSGRGHSITPGRLYLAHFLGPGGANTVLSRGDGETILAVMGANVVKANPFLRNYTVADLKAWADRKMRGAGSGGGSVPVVSAPRPVMTAEMNAYKEVIDQVLSEAG